MVMTRRRVMTAAGGIALMATAGTAKAVPKQAGVITLTPNSDADQTVALQGLIDDASARGIPVDLPAGRFNVGSVTLRSGTVMRGAGSLTTLVFVGTGRCLNAKEATGVRLLDFTLDGAMRPLQPNGALIALEGCAATELRGLRVLRSSVNGVVIKSSTGRVADCALSEIADAALFSLDSTVVISGNRVEVCGNNGILVWRTKLSEDGSQVNDNQISRIRADKGGSGQNGNGINVYLAGSVSVRGNRVTDCAYSAIRGNAASNIQMVGNSCQRIGEVALYAEFGFEGALIAHNIVDGAAAGISVTNFNEGGRLAVVQGNLIRNLVRREHESTDKRGEGISVEADSIVSGNTIENAATVGILLGWGRHMRDCSATGNLVRGCRVGIMISADPSGGAALVANNLISGASDGAIRAMTNWQLIGSDLAKSPPTIGRVTVTGNVVG
jgi:uncharacterized secreted repeat protein (TIGR03808 family)